MVEPRFDQNSMSSRIPSGTYRLQLHRGFTFKDASALVEYLHQLGVSDYYLSPITQARPGSVHGYDVVNHRAINPELGTEDDFRQLANSLQERDMGIVADIVPNHMAIADPANQWWQDVLENGPSSLYAEFFDIDWNPPKNDLTNKVLLPVLGDQYGRVLENQEIKIVYENGKFFARYYNNSFPLAPRSLQWILKPALREMIQKLGDSHPDVLELESILNSVEHLPARTENDHKKVRERRREIPVIGRRLAELYEKSAATREAIENSLHDINGVKGDPHSFDRLENLLADQAYRLSFWKVAGDEINYRRFFDINELAAIRMEDRGVFAATHEMILKLISQGLINGLRIDHVDGLLDPLQYLRRLQQGIGLCTAERDRLPDPERPFYVVVEKILGENEKLEPWPVHGTTGYEFMNVIGRLFVERENSNRFRDLYAHFIGDRQNFRDVVYDSKKLILRTAMSGEMAVLSRRLDRISEHHRWSRDFTLNSLSAALEEVIACFPVYRSYVRAETGSVSNADREHIHAAIRGAKQRNPAMSESIFDFVASVLLLDHPSGLTEDQRAERGEFVLRFQQLTAPVMAKGFEDTALYRYYPLASLNEVGGDPDAFGLSLDTFHQWNKERLEQWPDALSASSTHDTKRSEDTRARINVLSEIPDEWEQAIARWYQMNASARKKLEDGREVPDPNEEYLLYQALVGIWPAEPIDNQQREDLTKRIQSYMEKAVKEAKVHTSWMNVNEEHDRALNEFLKTILAEKQEFIADLTKFQTRIARAGMLNSLSQTLLKIALPGVPDFYQGTELWNLALVDPDNRRPVDYEQRLSMLSKMHESAERDRLATMRRLLEDMRSGGIKMYVTNRAMEFRRANRELFMRGDYLPLNPTGPRAQHTIGFSRSMNGKRVIVVCGRFFMRLPEARPLPVDPRAWGETFVTIEKDAPSRVTDLFTGNSISIRNGRLELSEVFAQMPIAMLHD
jgi:(1->4)-alpha-D-glucan 1-alpha-D-glucosylmutase